MLHPQACLPSDASKGKPLSPSKSVGFQGVGGGDGAGEGEVGGDGGTGAAPVTTGTLVAGIGEATGAATVGCATGAVVTGEVDGAGTGDGGLGAAALVGADGPDEDCVDAVGVALAFAAGR
jgi:hypothetical protein